MQIQYTPLFELRLRHDYFASGDCPVVKIVPTHSTGRIMQALGIRLVERKYGVELFYSTRAASGSPLLQTTDPIKLSFLLRATDPLFLNYTDLPVLGGVKDICYFTNLKVADDQPVVFSVDGSNRLPVNPANFKVKINQTGESVQLKDELGNELISYVPPATREEGVQYLINPSADDPSQLWVQQGGADAGCYTFQEGEDHLSHFISGQDGWRQGDIGLVSIYLGDTGVLGKHILESGVVTPASFTIDFSARATKWRYHLIDKSEPDFQNFVLKDHGIVEPLVDSAVDPQSTRTLPDGSEAIVLVPAAQIPLRERPGPRFVLSMETTGRGRTNPTSLPLPSADANHISLDPTSSEADPLFYSDMYVYL